MSMESIVYWFGPVAPLVPLLVRNAYGWAVNSMKDGQIQSYEWKLLGASILKLGGLALFLSLGFELEGVDSTAIVAAIDAGRNDVLEPLFKLLRK